MNGLIDDTLTDDEVLALTQRKRLEILDTVLPEKVQTSDPKMLVLALQTLSDMDRAALGNKRAKTDDKIANTAEAAASAAATFISRMGNGNPFAREAQRPNIHTLDGAPLVTGITINDGEMDVGISTLNRAAFNDKMGIDN